MRKGLKRGVRKFWILLTMLDMNPRTQDDFLEELLYVGFMLDRFERHYNSNNIDQTANDYEMWFVDDSHKSFAAKEKMLKDSKDLRKELKKGHECALKKKYGDYFYQFHNRLENKGALKKAVSEILNELIDKRIIEKFTRETFKPGRNPEFYKLIKDKKVLSNLLNEFRKIERNINIEKTYIFHNFYDTIIRSPYIKEMVNMDLILEIENDLNFQFTFNERKFILNILLNSCSALMFTLNEASLLGNCIAKSEQKKIPTPVKNATINSMKRLFLFQVQLKMGEDFTGTFLSNIPFTYKINIEFHPEGLSHNNSSPLNEVLCNVEKNSLETKFSIDSGEKVNMEAVTIEEIGNSLSLFGMDLAIMKSFSPF